MCLSLNGEENPVISIDETTDKGKYNSLRRYYTKWNQIIKPRPRIIIDTHAGSGIVELSHRKDIFKQREKSRIYGSALIAIIKTLKISNNLKIILNEKDPIKFKELETHVEDVINKGIPVFQERIVDFSYKAFGTKRKRKMKQKPDLIFPNSPKQNPPRNYFEKRVKTNAEIISYNKPIELVIDKIISEHLGEVRLKNKKIKPVVLFFVDPCGMVSWNEVIQKICICSRKEEGTELILNWSWEAISRNLNNQYKNSILSNIYGTPIEKIQEEFIGVTKMRQFLDKYKLQLRDYFEYVNELGVPRKRKLKPKQSSYKKYFLLLCTNNPSGGSLAGYSIEKAEKGLREGFMDMKQFT